jgi:hypothetical protein
MTPACDGNDGKIGLEHEVSLQILAQDATSSRKAHNAAQAPTTASGVVSCIWGGGFAGGAPTGSGVRVQSGMTLVGERPATSPSSITSPGPGRSPASSHFSRGTSTPPVFSALYSCYELSHAASERDNAYPASEPPTQARVAGVNAGALPALALLRASDVGGGEGLFKMAK